MEELARLRVLASGLAPEVLDAVLASASCGVIVCGGDGRVMLHNAAAERIWPECITEPHALLVRAAKAREAAGPIEIAAGSRRIIITCTPLATRGAVALFDDVTALRELTHAVRIVHDRMAKLQAIGAALAEARYPANVAHIITKQMVGVLGAISGSLAVPDAGELVLVESSGLSKQVAAVFARFPVDAALPLARAYRSGLSVWVGSPDQRARDFPGRADVEYPAAAAAVPLIVNGAKLGAVGFGFRTPQAFDADERAQIEDLARHAAVALERARLYEAERGARKRFEALARASRKFAEAESDPDVLLECIVRELAAILTSATLIAIGDPHELVASRGYCADDDIAPPAVTDREKTVGRSGKSQIDSGVLCVPLRARNRIIGTLTAVRSRPAFTQDDLLLVEELAQHAALAVDNAARDRTQPKT